MARKTVWQTLDPDLAGPIRRAVQGVRSVQTTACAPAGSGGPSPPWWSLLQGCRASESESEGVRRDHAMRRDHLWAPRPRPGGVLPSSDTPCIRSPAAAVRRRRAAAGGYTHISNLRWNTCRTRRVACVILNAYLPPTLCADLDTDHHLGFWGVPVYDHNGLRGEMGRGRGE